MSLHVGEHRPHEVGHALSMKPAFDLQSPCLAHAAHDTSVSSQVSVHVAHECGQRTARYSELAPEHSPSLAHCEHEMDLSLQYPPDDATAKSADRRKNVPSISAMKRKGRVGAVAPSALRRPATGGGTLAAACGSGGQQCGFSVVEWGVHARAAVAACARAGAARAAGQPLVARISADAFREREL